MRGTKSKEDDTPQGGSPEICSEAGSGSKGHCQRIRGVGRQDHSSGKRTWDPHPRGPGPDGGPIPARFLPGNPPFRLHRGCRNPCLCLFHEQSLVFVTREERIGKNFPSPPPSWKVFLSQGRCLQGRTFHPQRTPPCLSNRFEPSVHFFHF